MNAGKLYINDCDRLAIDEWTEFHCGDLISLKLCDKWITTRIEMNGAGQWYAVGLPGLRLAGLTAKAVTR